MTDPELAALLAEWLPGQRWFAATAAGNPQVLAAAPGLDVLLVPGGPDRYLVPVSWRSEPAPDLTAARIGRVGGRTAYDGLRDPVAAAYWADLLGGRATVGGLAATAYVELPAGLPVRPLGAEQSNTSLVLGEDLLLKVFRRLTPGVNPDLEVTRRLGELGSAHVAPALGWVEGAGSTLAILQPFLAGAEEGWTLATARDRGDFTPHAHALGAMTAGLHADLARAFPARPATATDIAALVTVLHERRARAVNLVPQLAPYDAGLRAAYDAVAAAAPDDTLQRIHGDLHLGQVLRTPGGWVAIDFEGEPARPVAERTAPMSPLRDVAGMLRSLDYAELPGSCRRAFLDGYADVSGRDPRESPTLLRAYELDKAVYEAGYEAAYRPDWLPVPLRGIERLLEQTAGRRG